MRPRYETHQDRENAARVINKIARKIQRQVKPLSNEHPVNFALYNGGRLVKFVDVRCRRNTMWQYPTVMMSQRRLDRALQFAKQHGVALMVVVEWKDRLGYLRVDSTDKFERKMGGRSDRMDEADIEQLYYVPVGAFKLFPVEE